jgi:hypothetical protein
MEHEILEEAKMLSRDYSPLRRNSKKWKFSSNPEAIQDSITFLPPNLVQISRDLKTSEIYSLISLEKRLLIRKNPKLLKNLQKLWQNVNPFHLPGISEKVYQALLKVLYLRLSKDLFDFGQLDQMVKTDLLIDFSGGSCLTFAEFYDGIFELIDSQTKSRLPSEYCHLATQILMACEETSWSDRVNLFSKIHVGQKKHYLAPWMVQALKEKESLPKVLKTPAEFRVSPRLLRKKQVKMIDRENFNIRKLEKNFSEKILKKRFQLESPKNEIVKKNRKVKNDRKAVTFYSNYIEKISPLSSIYSASRGRNDILESVIKGRKNFKVQEAVDLF